MQEVGGAVQRIEGPHEAISRTAEAFFLSEETDLGGLPCQEVTNGFLDDKIALRLDESEQVDMVLGDGARDRGARADHISPIPELGAGIGYLRLETSPDPVRGRAAYVCDADIRAMVAEFGGEAR